MYKSIARISTAICIMMMVQFVLTALNVMTLDVYADTGQAAIKVKFQDPAATTPDGFNADYGSPYGPHSGLIYGWNQDDTNSTVVRQNFQGEISDSFIHASEQDVWEIALANGNYNISVTVGDAVYSSTNTLYLEGASVSENVYLQPGEHRVFDKNVTVGDNKLTMTFGSSAALSAIEIVPVVQVSSPQLSGLKAEYFSESNFTGNRVTRVDKQVKLETMQSLPTPGFDDQDFSVRWTGQIQPLYSETYTLETHWKGSVKLWVDGHLIIDGAQAHNDKQTGTFVAVAGRKYDIQVDYSNHTGNPKATLRWESASQDSEFIPQARMVPLGTPEITANATETDIALQWTPVFNADGYELEVDGVIQAMGTTTQYDYTNLEAGTAHSFRVRAYCENIIGEWTELLTKYTLPDVPGPIEATSSSSEITLTWPDVRGATGYDIETNNTIIDNGNSTTYVDSSLNPNTQRTYKVRAKNASGVGKWSPIIAKATLPGASGAINTSVTDTSITVSWDAVSGADNYDLEVDGIVMAGIVGTKYVHTNLQSNSTHTYRVRSKNGIGMSNWSMLVTAVTLPSIPQHLHATVATSQIAIAWDGVPGASGYDIEVDGAVLDNGLSMTFTHTGLEVNTEHTYRVRAKNGTVIGGWSGRITRSTLSGIPTNLRASATGNEITVTWDMLVGTIGYDLEVDDQIVDNGLNLTYIHSGLLPYSEHTYRVRARNAGGTGPWADAITVVTTLGKPQNIALTSTVSSITLTWDAVNGAAGYELVVDGELVDVGNETSYTHDGLSPYSWHVYRVRAINADVTGEWSDTLTKATLLGMPVIMQVLTTSSQITVGWGAVVGATGYDIEVDGTLVDNGANISFTHQHLSPNSEHTYRVRAKNANVYSDWSNWSTLVTQTTAPGVPKFISSSATTNSIAVTWGSVSGGESYDLEVDGTVINGLTGTAYMQDGLEPNTMHVYRVRSKNRSGRSEWSEKLEKRTTPEMIVNVGKDNIFNFVVVAPKKSGVTARKITVTYNPDDLEVLDLSAITPDIELGVGSIQGTNMSVSEFSQGKIVYTISNADKTVVNSIKLLAKTNEDSKITYTVE